MISGAAGVFTLFIETNVIVRVIAIGGFINCFFSVIPYVSFSSYVSLILCCYLYIMASRIRQWDIIFKSIQAVVILDFILFMMQAIHHDPLLNFGMKDIEHFGTLGQHMQMGSFGIIISALLINFTMANFITAFIYAIFCKSSWAFVCAGVGLAVNLFKNQKIISVMIIVFFVLGAFVWAQREHKVDSISGRIPVWQQTIRLCNKHPFRGWGIGTYKDVFFPLSNLHCYAWREAHNFIFQMAFETGYVATGCLLFALGCLWMALLKARLWVCLSGLAMILTDGLVHFPDRMLQTVPMIVIFLAYCSFRLRKDKICPSYSQN